MTLEELRTELFARGFDYLDSDPTRATRFIERAYQELCEEEDWPFLEATAEGAAPLTASDLRTIESVIDTTNQRKLIPLDRRNITDFDYTLSTEGTPTHYYVTDGDTINVYPTNTTNTISLRYWKVPTALVDNDDEPELPSRFHLLLVDGAAVYAYMDSDNYDAAREVLGALDSGKLRMREALLVHQHDQPDDFIVNAVDHQDG